MSSPWIANARAVRRALSRVVSFAIICTAASAHAAVTSTYFGWNLDYSLPGKPRAVTQLVEVRYVGASNLGLVLPNAIYLAPPLIATMPSFPGFDVGFGTGTVTPPESGTFQFQGMPDVEEEGATSIGPPLTTSFTFSRGGKGETTRTLGAKVDIDWVPAGTPTPWGTLPYPSISIIAIKTVSYGYYDPFYYYSPYDFIRTPGAPPEIGTIIYNDLGYVLGLMPIGQNTELSSDLPPAQSDIYGNRRERFLADFREVSAAFSATMYTLPVTIDIKPGTFPNVVNPSAKGVVRVAILSSDGFDATTVDPSSVKFGPNEALEAHYAAGDVNGDGKPDLILHFDIEEAGIACGDTSAVLTGTTFDGQAIWGADSLATVGCRSHGSGTP